MEDCITLIDIELSEEENLPEGTFARRLSEEDIKNLLVSVTRGDSFHGFSLNVDATPGEVQVFIDDFCACLVDTYWVPILVEDKLCIVSEEDIGPVAVY